VGGQAALTWGLENYPGSVEDPTGPKITARMREQAEYFGALIKHEEVKSVDLSGKVKKVVTNKGTYEGKTVILAPGASHIRLGIPGERSLPAKCFLLRHSAYLPKIQFLHKVGKNVHITTRLQSLH